MDEKQILIDRKQNITEEDKEYQISCNRDLTKGRPGNAEDGFCLYSEPIITRIISEKTLAETLSKEFTAFRSPIWAFKGEQLKQQFNGREHLRMLCIIWNMHGQLPQNYISELLNARECSHHLIVVATQECQRTIPVSLFCESKARWESSLSYSLGNKYSIVSSVTMNALHLVIFSHESINRYISAISTDIKATGVVNMVGNKGGIGISLEIGDNSFLFLNSHFASGQSNNEQRNMDYFKISSSLELPKYYHNQTEKLLKRFDFVIWMGDFNYRIQATCKNEVDQLINQKLFFNLLLKDQLFEQKKLGYIFQDFQEGLILFPPTYKMLNDVNTYPDGADARIPGWTDRIFFKQKVPDSLRLVNYEMAMNVLGSDHRPVFAQFMVQTKINPKFQPIRVAKKGPDCVIF